MKTKICTKCDKRKRLREFDMQSPPKQKYPRPHCRSCVNAYQRLHRKRNPRYFRDAELRSHFGITLQVWEKMFEKQGKRCAICKRKKPNTKKQWFTDHNHKTKKIRVRGILCGWCNSVLGYAQDNIKILRAAIAYLRRTNVENN